MWNGKREITAYALHGYHGYLPGLLSMIRSGKRTYFHQRMRKVRECLRSGERPLTMARYFKKINLSLTNRLDVPPLKWRGKTI